MRLHSFPPPNSLASAKRGKKSHLTSSISVLVPSVMNDVNYELWGQMADYKGSAV